MMKKHPETEEECFLELVRRFFNRNRELGQYYKDGERAVCDYAANHCTHLSLWRLDFSHADWCAYCGKILDPEKTP